MAVPPLTILDRVVVAASNPGTGSFSESVALLGYQTIEQAGGLNGQSFGYAAQSSDLTQWEVGWGTWTAPALTRNVTANSLGTTAAINFTAPPIIMISATAPVLNSIVQPALSNLTFFVNPTTGNDNNPGTSSLPFATIQRAVAAAMSYDYQGLFTPTINLGSGSLFTYNITKPIQLGELRHLPSGSNGLIVGDITTPSNVVVHNTVNGSDVFDVLGATAIWTVNGVTTDCSGFANHYSVTGSAFLVIAHARVNDSAASGQTTFAGAFRYGQIKINQATLLAAAYNNFANASDQSTVNASFAPIAFPAACNFLNGFISIGGHATFRIAGVSWTNFAGVTGPRVNGAIEHVAFHTTNGLLTDIPGNSPGSSDVSTVFVNDNTFFSSFAPQPPQTFTTNYAMQVGDYSLIFNGVATIVLTLLAPASFPGYVLWVRTTANQLLNSASANVVPLAGGAATTAILAATAGKWAMLQSDGTNWQVMAAN